MERLEGYCRQDKNDFALGSSRGLDTELLPANIFYGAFDSKCPGAKKFVCLGDINPESYVAICWHGWAGQEDAIARKKCLLMKNQLLVARGRSIRCSRFGQSPA